MRKSLLVWIDTFPKDLIISHRRQRRHKMGKFLFSRSALSLRMILSAFLLLGYGLVAQENNIDLDSLEKAARIYINYPSSENARLFRQGLPEQPLIGNFDVDRYDRLFSYVFENLEVLARQVSVGDREAVKLGFRLYNFSSGLFTMELDAMLGDLIRTHPQLFLEELGSSPNARWIKTLGYPLCESNLNFNDTRDAPDRYELEMRIKALESVTDGALVDLRNTCIAEIRKCLEKRYHDSQGIILDDKEYLALFKKAVIDVCHAAEIAYQVCQSIIEIEDASRASPFGFASERIVHSSGIFDELTALRERSMRVDEVLRNPPLAYTEEYRALNKMDFRASQLYSLATHPSFICPSGTSDDIKKSTYKRGPVEYYGEFKKAYVELVALMPEIGQEVQKNTVDLEAVRKRLK
jgi:hypothetical protein